MVIQASLLLYAKLPIVTLSLW